MRSFGFYLLLPLSALLLMACNKSDHDDPPVTDKIVAWVVGSMDTTGVGMILYTDNAGETWERQGTDAMFQGVDIMDVWAIDPQNTWIVCSGNRIYRTIDGGTTWMQVPSPVIPGDPDLCGISVTDNTTVWICGEKGTVFSSTDAGNNWTVYDTTAFRHGMMQGIHAVTGNIVYVVAKLETPGGPWGFLARTLNGGTTWDSVSLPGGYNRYTWNGIRASDSSSLIVYGQSGHYSVTHNGGNTWLNADQVSPEDINSLVMLSPDAFWIACDADRIFKTFDGGETWIEQTSAGPSGSNLTGIDNYYSQTALIVGRSADSTVAGKILRTTDGGNHWYLRHVSPSDLYKVAFAHNQ